MRVTSLLNSGADVETRHPEVYVRVHYSPTMVVDQGTCSDVMFEDDHFHQRVGDKVILRGLSLGVRMLCSKKVNYSMLCYLYHITLMLRKNGSFCSISNQLGLHY